MKVIMDVNQNKLNFPEKYRGKKINFDIAK